jgi:Fe-S-cluster-containing dehydrogenase component
VGASLVPVGKRYELVVTQRESDMEDRPIALRTTARHYAAHPDFARTHNETPPSIYPDRVGGSPQWGMSIDLNACTGCSACVIACQAENNIPVVGKRQVALRREMHWLRIDRYYGTTADGRLTVSMQPMLCQHCEKAPCEYVCPVNATVHSPDGLNEMVYNRCVGTRFCSNNCPYKIRRFNFFDYNDDLGNVERMAKNPEVTVRARGVIEKCTFCVQRIRRHQIGAKIQRRPLQRDEVQTACQQACPSGAIVFGDITDPAAAVSQRHTDARTYGVLNEIGTRPRVRYLARIDNLHPELDA